MVTFCSDLDSTLIYHRKRVKDSSKYVQLTGNEEHFMTKKSWELFQEVKQFIQFVPVTSRTIETYQEIAAGIGFPKFALVCNGGILLEDGKIDREWFEQSKVLAKKFAKEFSLAEKFLRSQDCVSRVTIEHEFRLYASSVDAASVMKDLVSQVDLSFAEVYAMDGFVMIVPKSLTKGQAIKRFRERFSSEFIIAAGDNLADVSMQQQAEVFVAPEILTGALQQCSNIRVVEGVFSDGVLQTVRDYLNKNDEKFKGGS